MGCGQKVPGWTVMRNCASGMQAVDSAINNILAGRAKLVLAGGVDALSRAPLLYGDKMVLWFSDMAAAKTTGQRLALFARLPVAAVLKPVIGIMKGLTDRMGGTRSGADGPRARARRDADLEAPRSRPERSRLLGDQRSLCRPGARLPRGMEGREVLPRGARPRRRDGRARPSEAQRRRRRHRARPPGRRVGHAHRAA